MKFRSIFLFALIIVSLPATAKPPIPAENESGIRLRDFLGAVYLVDSSLGKRMGIGWSRTPFYWTGGPGWISIEPKKGEWSWDAADRFVKGAHAQGIEVVPILAYTASWDESVPGNGFAPPADRLEWENYVRHVVAHYSKPPFNLRYFQIWNEPTIQAGFWAGKTNLAYIDDVYLPAAMIIRQYHCRVVFGGWPCGNSMQEYDRELRWHNAWRYTDILDIHYDPITDWQYLYDRWVKTGKCRGIWQTEIGFVDFPNYLPNYYLRALHWALTHRWKHPNQYKLFWYAAWGAGPDGSKCFTTTGASGKIVMSQHGERLAVINRLLGGAPLHAYNKFTCHPDLPPAIDEENPTVLGFQVGRKRIVVALILDHATLTKNTDIRITLPIARSKIRLLSVTGSSMPIQLVSQSHHSIVTLPASDFHFRLARNYGHRWDAAIAYLVIDRK